MGARGIVRVQRDKSLLLSTIIFDTLVWSSDPINSNNFYLNPDYWDDHIRTSGVPFVDSLWNHVVQITNGSSEDRQPLPAESKEIEDAFTLTLALGYPHKKEGITDLVKHQRSFTAYCKTIQSNLNFYPSKGPSDVPLQDPLANPYYFTEPLFKLANRKFAITKSGRFGIVPTFSQPGDTCCICPGMKVPLILRPREDKRFHLVGESYIHGVMNGEVMEQLDLGRVKLEHIIIVWVRIWIVLRRISKRVHSLHF